MLDLKRIQDTRIDNDLSQKQMAEILGISKYVYNNFESGRTKFSLEKIIEFANYFSLSLDYLLNLSNHKTYHNYSNANIKDINKKLLKIRKQENLSQEKFGNLLGIPQRTYASYEKNERPIPLEFLTKVAKATNYSLDYLTGRTSNRYIKK